jgi:hypothetical protein
MGNSDSKYNVKSFHGTDFLDQLVSSASENIKIPHGRNHKGWF